MAVSWKLPPTFTAKVVGVSFAPGYPDTLHELHRLYVEGSLAEQTDWLVEPIPAVFEREPDNPHDANAVAIHVPALGEFAKIGHLPRNLAQRVAPELEEGTLWQVGVHQVLLNPHYPERPGIDIECHRVEEP